VEDVGVEIEVLLVGPDGALWAGTRNDGLYVGEVENLVLSDYPQETVRDLALSPDGSIWAASRNGAWRYDGYEWFPYTVEDGLRANSVRAIAAGPDGTIWFGGSGLTRFGPDG
jgi:ligand-binding sensor domain-containing protein